MNEHAREGKSAEDTREEERKTFLVYVWGIGLALVLTLLSFGLVTWAAMPRLWLLISIGVLALVQMVVHFRCFLHIGWRENRDDLQLILFSALLLVIMVAGTVWIMASLALRMGMPMQG